MWFYRRLILDGCAGRSLQRPRLQRRKCFSVYVARASSGRHGSAADAGCVVCFKNTYRYPSRRSLNSIMSACEIASDPVSNLELLLEVQYKKKRLLKNIFLFFILLHCSIFVFKAEKKSQLNVRYSFRKIILKWSFYNPPFIETVRLFLGTTKNINTNIYMKSVMFGPWPPF